MGKILDSIQAAKAARAAKPPKPSAAPKPKPPPILVDLNLATGIAVACALAALVSGVAIGAVWRVGSQLRPVPTIPSPAPSKP